MTRIDRDDKHPRQDRGAETSDPTNGGAASPESDEIGTTRQEVGDEDAPPRQTPHVPEHEGDSDIQEDHPSPDAVPVLPANAAGTDRVSSGDQDEPVEPESMYDDRPERDKDHPPSDRVAAEDVAAPDKDHP